MGWFRAVLGAVVMTVGLSVASPASAQDDPSPEPTGVTVVDDGDAAQPESGIVRDEDTSATVRRIRRDLVIVAGLMTVALVAYVWHTSPSRRVRVAAQRAGPLLDGAIETDPDAVVDPG